MKLFPVAQQLYSWNMDKGVPENIPKNVWGLSDKEEKECGRRRRHRKTNVEKLTNNKVISIKCKRMALEWVLNKQEWFHWKYTGAGLFFYSYPSSSFFIFSSLSFPRLQWNEWECAMCDHVLMFHIFIFVFLLSFRKRAVLDVWLDFFFFYFPTQNFQGKTVYVDER